MNYFKNVNVNEHLETLDKLHYLSWAKAWEIALDNLKDGDKIDYIIKKNKDDLPYFGDPKIGYFVSTEVILNGVNREMNLPVLDNKHKTMRLEEYSYTITWNGRFVEKTVKEITSFDINKSIMRCLVKNLAMFGLGLNVYCGEDLPEIEEKNILYPKVEVAKEQPKIFNINDVKKVFNKCCNKMEIENAIVRAKNTFNISESDNKEILILAQKRLQELN